MVSKGTPPSQVVKDNKVYFDRANRSILTHHSLNSDWKDLCGAAELLLLSLPSESERPAGSYPVVQIFDPIQAKWHDIKIIDKGKGLVPPDPDERLDLGQAQKRFDTIKAITEAKIRVTWKGGPASER